MPTWLRSALGHLNRRYGLGSEHTYLYSIRSPSRPPVASIAPGLSWAPLPLEGAGALAQIGPFDGALAAPRLKRGDVCYAGYLEGRLAHYSWVQRSGEHLILEAGATVAIAEGEFWIYHCRTADWARGRGIYPATLARIVNDQFDAGYTVGWVYTTRENISSQKGIARAGFTFDRTVRAIRIGRRYCRLGGL